MNAALKSKLAKLEEKAKTLNHQQAEGNTTEILLLHNHYMNKALVLYSREQPTPEQQQREHEERIAEIFRWYEEYQKLSKEQQLKQDEQSRLALEKENEEFMAWYNSPDRLKFDEAYENKSKGKEASEDLESVIPSILK
jgi:hypothetical protein